MRNATPENILEKKVLFFIDGAQVDAKSISSHAPKKIDASYFGEDGNVVPRLVPSEPGFLTIDAPGLPTNGRHRIRIEFPDGRKIEFDADAVLKPKEPRLRFYQVGEVERGVVDKVPHM